MDSRYLIQILQGEFFQRLARRMSHLVKRDAHFPSIPSAIKIAIGMRRTGKTTLLYQTIHELMAQGVPRSQILYLNLEDDRLSPLDTAKLSSLIDAWYALHPSKYDDKHYLFLDEIQNVINWPAIVRRLHDTKDIELYLTGSSAKLLSKEIATSLRGRSFALEVWPFSFVEYLRSKKIPETVEFFDARREAELTEAFHDYLSNGGFPAVIGLSAMERNSALQEYLQVAAYRDIVERHSIHNAAILKSMIQLMIHNVARPFSITKLHNALKGQGFSISRETLYHYAEYIEDTFLAFSVPLYSHSVRKTQVNLKKCYAIDPGLVRSTTLDFERDLGRLFENIVYLDLRRLGYEVSYYLTQERYEVDFFVQSPRGEKRLFQVAWDIDQPETEARELRALESAKAELGVQGELVTLRSYLSGQWFQRGEGIC